MSTAIIDADVICYQSSAAAQRDYGFEVWSDLKTAILDAKEQVEEQTKLAECTDTILVFSPRSRRNWRKLIMPLYKENRKAKPKPICYNDLRIEMEKMYKHVEIDWLEGDDVLPIIQQKIDGSVIVSIDKDMKTITGMGLNPMKQVWPEFISPARADYFWYSQILMGDTTDGYKGLFRCGEKGADKILSPHYKCDVDDNGLRVDTFDNEAAWADVQAAYDEKGQEDILVQARVSRILRPGDYNRETRTITLWHPDATKVEYLELPK
tara:strand:+ start:33 stop:830 length:798 start_codon:yes stop_codon:yes gene_type:complete